MRYDAIVIGGGIGGLASAALLSAQGRKVLLCEATDRLGGFQRRFEVDGFQFEPNFHFLQDVGPGRPVRNLLAALGIEQEFHRVDPVAQMRYGDRDVVVPNDRAEFIARLQRDFPHEASNIEALFAEMRALYLALTQQQPSPLIAKYAGDTMHAFVSHFVADPALRAITSMWSAYFGYGSDHITALGIVVFTESCWDGGVYHPVGGITSVIDKLRARIEARGGEVRVATPVAGIVTQNGRAAGVRLADGSVHEAPIVVSNVDTLTTLRDMVDDKALAASAVAPFTPLERFRSPFAVYLGVRGEGLGLRDGAATRVSFKSYDLDAQDRAQLAGDVENAPLPMGIPTRINPELAPAGHDIVILYTFLPNTAIDALVSDAGRARAFAERMVRRAEHVIPGLGNNIVVMETTATKTPMLYSANSKGALGWSPDPQTLPRMPDHKSSIPGLYLCGQWTRTGGGINNVLASAHFAAGLVLAETR